MVRTREATLVTSAAEVVEEVGRIGELAPQLPLGIAEHRPTDGLDTVAGQVHGALPASGGASERQLAQTSGIAMDDVRGALPMLEMEGFARLAEDGWHRVVRR